MRAFVVFFAVLSAAALVMIGYWVDYSADMARRAAPQQVAAAVPGPPETQASNPAAAKEADRERFRRQAELQAELMREDWMQPPLVPPRTAPALARISAEMILTGRCRKSDLEHWGWGPASSGDGRWFTYCSRGGQPQIVYVKP